MMRNLIVVEKKMLEPFQANGFRIIPVAQVWRFKIPGWFRRTIMWNRPVEVVVEFPNGVRHTLPVSDVTLQKQIALLSIGLLGSFLLRFVFQKRRKGNDR